MRAKHWLMLLVLSVLWGATFIFVKEALTALPPLTITLVRCAVAAAVLVPAALAMGVAWPGTVRAWCEFLVMSILNNVLPFALIFYGQTMIASGLTSVMNATTPLMTLLVARFVAGEKLAAHKVAGVLLGLVGVALMMGPSVLAGDRASALGMALVVAAALSYGCSALWGRRFKTTAPVVSAASQLLCSTVLLVPLAGVVDRFWQLPLPPVNVIIVLTALGVLSTALAYVLFFRIMAEAGSNNVMLVTLLIPVSAVALGAWHFGERLSANQFVGGIVIAGSLLVIDGRLFGLGRATEARTVRT